MNAGGLKGALLTRAINTKLENWRTKGEVTHKIYDILVFRKVSHSGAVSILYSHRRIDQSLAWRRVADDLFWSSSLISHCTRDAQGMLCLRGGARGESGFTHMGDVLIWVQFGMTEVSCRVSTIPYAPC
jgi:hypothetical protein